MNKKETKKLVQKEILALLDERIDNEIVAMEDFYTVAEITREVLLSSGYIENSGNGRPEEIRKHQK